jgi:hypothetical protein
MGKTGGVVTGVRTRQRSTVQTQCGDMPCYMNVNTMRKSTNCGLET